MHFHSKDQQQSTKEKRFSKKERLLNRSQFLELSRNSQKIQNEYFVIRFRKGQSGQTRLGITLTKRVGNAVTRNKIKRHIREFFRCNKLRFGGVWDINLIAKQSAAGLTPSQIPASLENLFKKLDR
jgi:ribonuclease P protein component